MKRGLAWSLLGTLIGAVGGLVVTPTLVHSLGPAEFGLYILVLTVASYGSFFDLGLTWAATRYFAEDMAQSDHLRLSSRFHTLTRFLFGVTLLSTVLAVTAGPPFMRAAGAPGGSALPVALLLAAVSFGLTLQAQLCTSLLRAAQRFDEAGRAAVVGSVLLPIGSYAVVRLLPGLIPLLVVNASVNLVVLLLYARISAPQLAAGARASRWQPGLLRGMASFGGWSSASRLLMVVILQMDRLAVALLGTVRGLTFYAIPANLGSRVNLFGSPSAGLFFARASLLHASGDRAELSRQHSRATRFLVWSALGLALPLVSLGPDFLRVWIGTEMALSGGPVLIVFAAAYAVNSVASLDAVTLEACGRVDVPAKAMLFWSLPAVAAVLLFAPRYGFLAIACAVGGWLAGVGLTNMTLSRWLALDSAPSRGLGSLLTGAVAVVLLDLLIAGTLRPFVQGISSALTAMCVVGVCSLLLGFFVTLGSGERRIVFEALQRPFPNRQARSGSQVRAATGPQVPVHSSDRRS